MMMNRSTLIAEMLRSYEIVYPQIHNDDELDLFEDICIDTILEYQGTNRMVFVDNSRVPRFIMDMN